MPPKPDGRPVEQDYKLRAAAATFRPEPSDDDMMVAVEAAWMDRHRSAGRVHKNPA